MEGYAAFVFDPNARTKLEQSDLNLLNCFFDDAVETRAFTALLQKVVLRPWNS